MRELAAVCAATLVLLSLGNIFNCVWEHDTRQLVPWAISFNGWLVAFFEFVSKLSVGDRS